MNTIDLQVWIHSANQLACIAESSDIPVHGELMNNPKIIEDGSIGVAKGEIVYIGTDKTPPAPFVINDNTNVIDAKNCLVTPGLVDCHTHIIFGGNRADEFSMKIQGIPYMEIAKRGGGIHRTVRDTRASSRQQLLDVTRTRLNRLLPNGITTVEIKTGYGLSFESEITLLEVIKEAQQYTPVKLVPTLLAAHEIPEDMSKQEYMQVIKEKIIPYVAEHKLAEFCDIFCEKGVYTLEDSRDILNHGKKFGLKVKIHADQLTPSGGSILAGEINAYSADHLDYIDNKGMDSLLANNVVPVLLPGCNFFMGLRSYAPARQLIRAGLPVALSTDFNPGSCMTQNLLLIMTIACTQMRMTPAETLTATTINAAASLALHDRIGILAPGYKADIVVWDVPAIDYLAYHFGEFHAGTVIINGNIVFRK